MNLKKIFDSKTKGVYNGVRYISFSVTDSRTICKSPLEIVDGIQYEPNENHKGGIIAFSIEVNAVQLDENKLVNLLKQKLETLKNRIFRVSKIDEIAKKNNLTGWTIGKFLNGRYRALDDSIYSEKSLTVELVGIDDETLFAIAEEMCTEFKQESVLVKSYNSGRIMFIDDK